MKQGFFFALTNFLFLLQWCCDTILYCHLYECVFFILVKMHSLFPHSYEWQGIVSQQSEQCIFSVRGFGCALFYFEVWEMEIDTTFIGKTAAHHILIIFFPLLLIFLVCAIIIVLLQGKIKSPVISLILRFIILAVGALVWVALLPVLTKIALSWFFRALI